MTAILFLTVHKSASTFFGSHVLPRLARNTGYRRIDPFKDAWREGRDGADIVLDVHAGETDCILGPVRTPASIHDATAFDAWKKPLVLRDPRDVVTSFYFSEAFSHTAPPSGPLAERMAANRQSVLGQGIDAYVLKFAPAILDRFLDYRDRFAGRPNLCLLRYEQMVTDWDGFSATLRGFLDLQVREPVWRKMLPSPDEFVVEEDVHAHKRQVAPGDHRRKLRPATVAELDALFAPALDWLGYERSRP